MLIDTSGFFATHSEEDKNYAKAKEIYQKSRFRLTTNYILAEYVPLAMIRGLPRDGVVAFSQEILDDETIEIIWVSN